MLVPAAYNFRSLWVRKARTLLTLTGIAAVVAVYVVMTAVSGQMKAMFSTTGKPDELIVLQAGALNTEFSQVSRGTLTWLATQPQVAVDGGAPLISAEMSLASRIDVTTTRGAPRSLDGMLRGVDPAAVRVYRELHLDSGTPLAAGTGVLVGTQLARAQHIAVGDTLTFERQTWRVAGIFSAEGALYEQEVWVDLDALGAAANRTDVTGFLVRAKSAGDAVALVDAISAQRSEPVQALTSKAAFARVGGMSIWMAALGQFIAIVIAMGAIFGGMNTMYSAVAQRSREFGILRALGYRKIAVLLSMLFESLLVGLLGGLLGCVLAFAVARVPLNMPFLLEGAVPVGGRDLVAGLILALLIGGLGGILPALQAGAVKVVDALR